MSNQHIIVHIGPYKTGSTSIQSRLSASIDHLALSGICYAPDYGIADMNLGRQLSKKEGIAVSDRSWWLGDDSPPGNRILISADLSNSSSRIYSSETFCDADYLAVRQWASEISYSTCDIISAIREPRAWLLSSYFQESMTEDLDFESYVATHLKSKKYFLSYLSSLWALPRSKFRVIPHRNKRDIWMDFCRVVKITAPLIQPFFSNKNETPRLIESLYYSFLPTYVKSHIPRVVDWAGEIPNGFLQRTLLDINIVARPFNEWSRQWDEADFLNRGIITTDSLAILEEYKQFWLSDADECMTKGVFADEDLIFISEALEEYKEQGAKKILIPNSNFKEKLPINAEFDVIVRMIAVSVGMRRQGILL